MTNRKYTSNQSALKRVMFLFTITALGMTALAGCQTVDRVRTATDIAFAVAEKADVEALVQVDLERQRLRRARCHNPMLTPAVLSEAANDQRLGTAWVDELLRDCPQFSAFLSDLVLRRAMASGLIAPNTGRIISE